MSGRDAEYYSAETPYAQANALCAVMGGDTDAALDLLDDLFPNELKNLIDHAEKLSELADQVLRMKGAR